jgi:hypothetical protein
VLNFYHSVNDEGSSVVAPWNERLSFKVLVPRRSLLVLTRDLYHRYMHGIDELLEDTLDKRVVNLGELKEGHILKRETRISLTI